mmetsp:Transcript_22381/g.29024  ORF Transcript_22381/g.29024 Transcript_22381/m.29024 type:complete len:174 (-) Transcript_22381:312-833(-)
MSLSILARRPNMLTTRALINGANLKFLSSDSKPLYSERMAKLGRPVSPHVFIYDWPVVALSSITNRVAGVILYGGVAGVGLLSMAGLELGPLMTCLGNMSVVGPAAKAIVAYPIVYHYLGGLRHIIWDNYPDLLTNDQVKTSSFVLFGASAAAAAGAACITLPAKEETKKEDA